MDDVLKPLRSKNFMSFAHNTKPAPCCVCREKPFVQLHHFGSDGGRGMKPSDYEVARLCHDCALKYEIKRRGLINTGQYEILAAFQQDALELHDAWLRQLEETRKEKLPARCNACEHCFDGNCCAEHKHIEPDTECALEELNEELYCGLLQVDEPENARSWLLSWANRRNQNVLKELLYTMKEIYYLSDDEIKNCAYMALRIAGMKKEEINERDE